MINTAAQIIKIIDCGLVDYEQTLSRQKYLHQQRLCHTIPDTVLIAEHYPVITLGARQNANKLRIEARRLKEKNIDLVQTRRGGGVTAHNEGQILFYPILNLKERGLGITEYIRELEQIGITLLHEFGIASELRKGFPGLWIKDRKIASIGVRVAKFVTYHGMAINIRNDLSIFDYIVPCGIENIKMTSVFKETGAKISMVSVRKSLSILLGRYFS
ncbi:MAG: lipoyl(octanoyl) transferase LipB [Phycisphaerae bacterium]